MKFKKISFWILGFVFLLAISTQIRIPNQLTQQDIKELDAFLKYQTQEGQFSGVVMLAQQDSIIYHQAFGHTNSKRDEAINLNTKFYIGSLTKQFTALLVVKLCHEKGIDFHTPIANFLPDFVDSPITIHQLLSHTSGIKHYEGLEDVLPIHNNESRNEHFAQKKWKINDYVHLIKEIPLKFKSGKWYKYSSFNYILLGAIAEKISKKPYQLLIEEYISQPLDLQHTVFSYEVQKATNFAQAMRQVEGQLSDFSYQDQSVTFSTGGLYSNSEDLYRWLKAFYLQESLNTTEIEAIHSKHSEIGFQHFYGYGIMIRNGFGHLLKYIGLNEFNYSEHGGQLPGFRSSIVSIEQGQLSVIILSNIGNGLHPRKITSKIMEKL